MPTKEIYTLAEEKSWVIGIHKINNFCVTRNSMIKVNIIGKQKMYIAERTNIDRAPLNEWELGKYAKRYLEKL